MLFTKAKAHPRPPGSPLFWRLWAPCTPRPGGPDGPGMALQSLVGRMIPASQLRLIHAWWVVWASGW